MAQPLPRPPGPPGESETQAEPLAALRQDLRLFPGPRGHQGAPSTIAHDPANESYFQFGPLEMEMLARWQAGTAPAIAAKVSQETVFACSAADVETLAHTLTTQGLLRHSAERVGALAARRDLTKRNTRWTRAINGIVFRRLPLVRPQRFLDATLFLTNFAFTRAFWGLLGATFIVIAYLIAREAPAFLSSLRNMFAVEGAITLGITLAFAKSIHELAHGYAARRYGADVPTMGVMLIVLWPLLYTETTAAWTLQDRTKRVVIAAAGVASEMVIAVAALLAWLLLEPGPWRDAAGFAGTTLLVLSLLFNANPLMKFDGYFILSELTRTDNAQPRAIAHVRALLRHYVAGQPLLSDEARSTPSARRWLTFYGVACLLYRVVLFGGIAITILALLFPIIAYPLAGGLLLTMLIKPAVGEIFTWFKSAYEHAKVPGVIRVAAILALIAAPAFVPWRSTVQVPALVAAGETHEVFAPEPAQLTRLAIKDGATVRAGERLMDLRAPELETERAGAYARALTIQQVLARRATGTTFLPKLAVQEEELAQLRARIAGLDARRRKLVVRAPTEGRIAMADDGLAPGLWLAGDAPILYIIKGAGAQVHGYAEERDLGLIKAGADGVLWLEGQPFTGMAIKVRKIHTEAMEVLDDPLLAGGMGGPIAAHQREHTHVPEQAIYKLHLDLVTPSDAAKLPALKTRGYVRIKTRPRSIARRVLDRLINLWRREFG
ncbi:MAG: hypothetical protein AAFR04_12395 [Pseudomonadota bacterium]